jgi:hypothetical protein
MKQQNIVTYSGNNAPFLNGFTQPTRTNTFQPVKTSFIRIVSFTDWKGRPSGCEWCPRSPIKMVSHGDPPLAASKRVRKIDKKSGAGRQRSCPRRCAVNIPGWTARRAMLGLGQQTNLSNETRPCVNAQDCHHFTEIVSRPRTVYQWLWLVNVAGAAADLTPRRL